VKQAVVGYGRADKQQVQKMVALLLGLQEPPEPDDVADALAVALCHAHRMRYPKVSRRSDRLPRRAPHPEVAEPIVVSWAGWATSSSFPSTYYELPEEVGSQLHVHTHARGRPRLYGFSSVTERLFQRLIAVNGVGPALALKVMSGLEPKRWSMRYDRPT
jgi:hypothetical protein